MLTELTTQHKVTGAKQVTRALKNAKALRVFMAQDADPRVTEPIQDLCEDLGVDIEEVAQRCSRHNTCPERHSEKR